MSGRNKRELEDRQLDAEIDGEPLAGSGFENEELEPNSDDEDAGKGEE